MAATGKRRGDLGAACAAVATLAFLVLILGLHPMVAAPLAVAVYLGVRFLEIPSPLKWFAWRDLNARVWPANDIREATADEQAYAAAFEHARALRAVAHQIPKPLVR